MEGIDGRWVNLSRVVDRNYVVYDSVLVESGSRAILSRSVEGVETMYLSVKGVRGSVQLLMENAEYTISGSMEKPAIKTSSKAQNDLNAYNELTGEFYEKLASILETYYAAIERDDQAAADSILGAYILVNIEKGAVDSVFLAKNPSSFASVLILRGSFYKMDVTRLEETLTSLDPSLHQMEEYDYIYGKMEKQKDVAVGKPLKEFELETPDGEMLKVSEVHNGNVLLIDFWASWCGPCRRANPEIVELYDEYHGQGFEILGVSLDRDTASWRKAIADDNLAWSHISDVKGWNCEAARLYGVPSIPHTVLVDRDGIIRGNRLHGEELREAVESLL
jgi:peroxiredoxin